MPSNLLDAIKHDDAKDGRVAVRDEATNSEPWTHFAHQGDVGIRGFGASASEAFENAARAMTSVVTPIASLSAEETSRIRCEAPDLEILFVDWLNAVIYEMATRQMLFRDFHVDIQGCALSAEAYGDRVDIRQHQPAVELKGATMTELKVGRGKDGRWIAQCVVDV